MKRVHFAGWFTCVRFSDDPKIAGTRKTLCGRVVDQSVEAVGTYPQITCLVCKNHPFIDGGRYVFPFDASEEAAEEAMR